MKRHQRLRALLDDQGGQSPWTVMAGLVVFVIVSVGVAAGMTGGLVTTAALKQDAAVERVAGDVTARLAMPGYDSLREIVAREGATREVALTVGARSVPAIRTIELKTATRTARVTITAPKYDTVIGDYGTTGDCVTKVRKCIVATEFVNGTYPAS